MKEFKSNINCIHTYDKDSDRLHPYGGVDFIKYVCNKCGHENFKRVSVIKEEIK